MLFLPLSSFTESSKKGNHTKKDIALCAVSFFFFLNLLLHPYLFCQSQHLSFLVLGTWRQKWQLIWEDNRERALCSETDRNTRKLGPNPGWVSLKWWQGSSPLKVFIRISGPEREHRYGSTLKEIKFPSKWEACVNSSHRDAGFRWSRSVYR